MSLEQEVIDNFVIDSWRWQTCTQNNPYLIIINQTLTLIIITKAHIYISFILLILLKFKYLAVVNFSVTWPLVCLKTFPFVTNFWFTLYLLKTGNKSIINGTYWVVQKIVLVAFFITGNKQLVWIIYLQKTSSRSNRIL